MSGIDMTDFGLTPEEIEAKKRAKEEKLKDFFPAVDPDELQRSIDASEKGGRDE